MATSSNKPKIRRQLVRERRTQLSGAGWRRLLSRAASWPVLAGAVFLVTVCAIALYGEATLGYTVGQHVDQPIRALVRFQVPDERQTAADREAAKARTPSYYTRNPSELTYDRVRADLKRLYQAAADAESFERFKEALAAFEARSGSKWPAEDGAYQALRALVDEPEGAGERKYNEWVLALPLERELVVAGLLNEPRVPRSTVDHVMLETPSADGGAAAERVPQDNLIRQRNDKALRGSAASLAEHFQTTALAKTVEAIVLVTWGVWAAISHAAPRDVVPAEVVPAEVVSAEMVAVYDAMLIPTVKPVDFTGWAAAERVAMTAEALAVAAQPESRMTWQPGFEAYLREVLQFGDEEIVDAVYLVLGKRAVRLAEKVFQQMPKPSP